MELLAFIDAAIAYEDPLPVPELRSSIVANFKLDLGGIARQSGLVIVVAVAGVLVSAADGLAMVQQGDQGSEVTTVQQALQTQGFDPGPIDGKFGPQTALAVRQFQSSQGLAVDGIVGPDTEKALGLSSSGSLPDSNRPGNAGTYRVNTPSGIGLVIRSAPGINSEKLGGFPENALVQLIPEEQSDGRYTWGRLAGQSGWVAKEFLVAVSPQETDPNSPAPPASPNSPAPLASEAFRVDTPSNIGLIIRQNSSQTSRSLGTLAEGEIVQVTATTRSDGRYTWRELANRDGWIAQEFLVAVAKPAPNPSPPDNPGGRDFRVTASGLNIRQQASVTSPILDSFPQGAQVKLTSEERRSDGYLWGKLADRRGWVAMNYLQPIRTSGGGGTTDNHGGNGGYLEAEAGEADPQSEEVDQGNDVAVNGPGNATANQPEPETSPVAPEPDTTSEADSRADTTADSNGAIATNGETGTAPSPTPTPEITTDPPGSATEEGETSSPASEPPTTATGDEPASSPATPTPEASPEASPSPPNTPETNGTDANAPEDSPPEPSLAIVDDVDFGLGRIARVSGSNLEIRRQPDASSDHITQVDQGIFVAYTRRVRLANDQEWFFFPAYGGWGISNDIELID
jgi:peptidoglycan hydrolase-like protein with peptidoglycan-binding domain